MRHHVRHVCFVAAVIGLGAISANAQVGLLPDPVSATASSTYSGDIPIWGPQNLFDQSPTTSDFNQVIDNGAEYAGEGEGPHVVVFDYGAPVSFDGVAYAQRASGAELDADRVPEINVWVTDTDPGPAALDLAILSSPPAANVYGIDMTDLAFNAYAFGQELAGQYVVFRLEAGGTFNPGGGELALVSGIPEPSALALAAVGVFGLLTPRRRRVRIARRLSVIVIAAASAILHQSQTAAHAADIRTVALTGQQAPGTPIGVNYSSFSNLPRLNDVSQTAFSASLTGSGVDSTNNTGIWSESSGSLAPVARAGSQAPGTPSGVFYSSLGSSPRLNNAGQTAFLADLTGSGVNSTNDRGIWSEGSGSLALVAREGDQAPGTPSGVNFAGLIGRIVLNDAGQIAFAAQIAGSGVVYPVNANGIWSEGSGSLALVARSGSQAQGIPAGTNYDGFGFPPALNNAGQTAFWAYLSGSTLADQGIWSEGSGNLALVARTGQQAPGAPSGVNYKHFATSLLWPVLNNAGQIAFKASLSSGAIGIWSDRSGSLALVALSGKPAPGTLDGVNFNLIERSLPALNDAGQTALIAGLTGSGVDSTNSTGIWSESSGSLALVSRSGDHAPGTPSGVNYSNFFELALNDASQIAFRGSLTGSGVDSTNSVAIWATDRTGAVQLIARTGDPLEVAPGDFRTVSGLIMNGSYGFVSSGFNNLGQLAFQASFTDGSSGIFVSNRVAVPEPSSLVLLGCATGAVLVIRRRVQRARGFPSAAMVACLAAAPTVTHAAAVRTVAISGQQAPGTSGSVTYHPSNFSPPELNDAGQAAFTATLTGAGVSGPNDSGYWSEGSGSLTLVAREGSQAPGTPDGVSYREMNSLSLVLNDAGQTVFYGALAGGGVNGSNERGIWSAGSGSLALVARQGTQAVGAPSGANYSLPTGTLPTLNNAGQVAFRGLLTGGGVDSTNDSAIWSEGSGSLALVARSGSPAPGTGSGVNYGNSSGWPFGVPVLNDAGQVAFLATLTGSGVDLTNQQGIWAERSGSLALVTRIGSQAPGTLNGASFSQFGAPVINNAGQTAFAGLLGGGVDSTNDRGIWSEGSGSLALVARKGSQAPGSASGVNFFVFGSSPVLNDAGQTAFSAYLSGTGLDFSNDQGIWAESSAGLALVAREGSQAPGAPSGASFSFQSSDSPALNNAGQTAFIAFLTGSGVDSTNNRGIWATDLNGAMQLIARRGDALEVAPGDFRTINFLGFVANSGNSDGGRSSFNNSGQLAFSASFTDGSAGVFVSNLVAVPEPSSLLLAALATAGLLKSRRSLR